MPAVSDQSLPHRDLDLAVVLLGRDTRGHTSCHTQQAAVNPCTARESERPSTTARTILIYPPSWQDHSHSWRAEELCVNVRLSCIFFHPVEDCSPAGAVNQVTQVV